MQRSFIIVLFVAFIDYMGVGLVYPLFSSMLFDHSYPLLSPTTTDGMRGTLLGFLLCLMPLAQFFGAPFWGALSDSKGRKPPLQISLFLTLCGYVLALCGVFFHHIVLLLVSRVVVGFGSGNMSIVQATIADLSSAREKTKNFGLYGMALGTGFTIGPFFGGFFSHWGYNTPFLFSVLIVALNLFFVAFFFKETHHTPLPRPLTWNIGITHLKRAIHLHGMRVILLASFLYNFAWAYFFEFIPVYLITRFQFSPEKLGVLYGVAGGCYALSAGLFIRPLIKRFSPALLFSGGTFFTSFSILAFLLLPSPIWIWPMMMILCYFVSFLMPTSTSLVSNHAAPEMQGEALGILSSVNSAALVLSPLFSGALVGAFPTLPMWVGGITMLLVSLLLLLTFWRKFR